MWLLFSLAHAGAFEGPSEVHVHSDDIVVAWKNVDITSVVVTAVHVDDAATLQVVPPRLPRTVEPGRSLKILVVADGTLAPGFVTVETSAGPEKLWVDVARAYVPVVSSGSARPAGTTRAAATGPSATLMHAETATAGGGNATFGHPEPTLQVRGPMDPDVVERVLGWRRDAMRTCAGDTVQDLVAAFDLDATGRVIQADVQGGGAAACLETVLSETAFPNPGAPVSIRWTFTLGD
jgi:hypothetical protein